ncbi:MAG: hypothetical protein NTW28_37365 [Candidatus Solibacter sp.]|nr:hypothetical protein [Candidatus Solibacter sp.]
MTSIELTGLKADIPMGAMAAIGVLRICQRMPGFTGSKLAWEAGGGGDHAVLWTPGETTTEALGQALAEDVKKAAERDELNWEEQIKTQTPVQFRARAEALLKAGEWETAEWFTAFASELVCGRDEKVDATPFDMSVARQKFLADARKLAAGLGEDMPGRNVKPAAESYREALFGPWKYEDDQHSLGWDPSTMKLGAFTYKAPTSMANAGVRAAVWLAFESLPLFPCFAGPRGKLEVRAFRHDRRDFTLCWPVWRQAISIETLGTLLGWEGLVKDTIPATELAARGVTAVYRSERFKPNKYLSSFRAAELAAGAVG